MKVAIASDHGGFQLKAEIIRLMEEMGIEYKDFGPYSEDSVDYPDYAIPVSEKVAAGEYDRGILICGTGIGMSIAANKVKGIRCALCHDVFSARMTREHNNTNILAMAKGSLVGLAREIAKTWLTTEFTGGKHERRVCKISITKKIIRKIIYYQSPKKLSFSGGLHLLQGRKSFCPIIKQINTSG